MTDALPATRRRLDSIDALRGLIMIIMALDHIRDFTNRAAMVSSPTDLTKTTPILFFTRWITHFCAPVFMFTAGLGAFLWWQRGKTRTELSTFLLTRGVWLVVLELTVMRLAYDFDIAQSYPVLLIVLWVFGVCMIAMAALIWLPLPVLGVLSVAGILLHNTLDGIQPARFGAAAPLWNLIHQPGVFVLGKVPVIIGYPLVPWVCVMALGFVMGRLYQLDAAQRRRYLMAVGAASTLAFVALRALNIYGDPSRWSAQKSATFTVLSFLNTTKYPPSLLFLLMTLGPAFLMLAWMDQRSWNPKNPLIVFGRVPLFYFIVHFYAAHVAAVLLSFARYGTSAMRFVFHPVPSMGGPVDLYPADFGWSLLVTYAVWATIVIAAYPLCRWFADVKARRRDWWLSYL